MRRLVIRIRVDPASKDATVFEEKLIDFRGVFGFDHVIIIRVDPTGKDPPFCCPLDSHGGGRRR